MTPPENRYRIEVAGRSNWRRYQEQLRRGAQTQQRRKRLLVALLCALVLAVGVSGLFHVLIDGWPRRDAPGPPPTSAPEGNGRQAPLPPYGKSAVQELINGYPLVNYRHRSFEVIDGDARYLVDTTLLPSLQKYVTDRLHTTTARYIAIVVMVPDTGRVLAMSGFNKLSRDRNPCLKSDYPAASIAKIITASAALEKGGLTPSSKMTFNGGKHTLYKSQLKNRTNRYSNTTTLTHAFADSINPVFGKIGIHVVGDETLRQYAERFGFNRAIPFELSVGASQMVPAEDSYHLAELASGFNRQTRISPLHGAMVAAAVADNGMLREPTIIDRVWAENGRAVYESRPQPIGRAISEDGARHLRRMMQTTVNSGTGRKAFKGYRRDRILSQLEIGGKTGSIDNTDHDARYDWFVGFARSKSGDDALAVAIMVAHEKYLGMRAAEYARLIIRRYYQKKT